MVQLIIFGVWNLFTHLNTFLLLTLLCSCAILHGVRHLKDYQIKLDYKPAIVNLIFLEYNI